MLKIFQGWLQPKYIAFDIPAAINLPPRLVRVLEQYHPMLLMEHEQTVLPSAIRAAEERLKLEKMQADYQPIIAQCTAEYAGITAILDTSYNIEKPNYKTAKGLRSSKVQTDRRIDFIVMVGLSFMLALGIAHYLEIQIKNPKLEQLPLLLLGIVAALGITLGSKRAIVSWVISHRSTEPIQTFPHYTAFWEPLRDGDTLSWMSVAIPVGEMFFAAPGLLDLLPPEMSENPLSWIATFVVAGLTAMVNIFLAWGQAWEQIRFNREREVEKQRRVEQEAAHVLAQKERDANPQYQQYCQQREQISEKLGQLQEDLELQARTAQIQFDRAKQSFEQWMRVADRWCRRHKRLIAAA